MAAVDGTRVYVGNLAYSTTWQALKDHCSNGGTLEVVHADILTYPNGRSKGCGIVTYATVEDAQRAMSQLTDTTLDGRPIFVREDRGQAPRDPAAVPPPRPKPARAPAPAAAPAAAAAPTSAAPSGEERRVCYKCGVPGHLASQCTAADADVAQRKLFVSNLAYSVSWQDLKDAFAAIGPVQRADVLKLPNGRSKGVGVVVMEKAEDATRALEQLQGAHLHQRPIALRRDQWRQ